MTAFANNLRAAIVYQPRFGYMVVTTWMNATGGGRFKGDHHVSGNDKLPMLSVLETYPDSKEGEVAAMEYCMFLNDKSQLAA